MFSKLGFAVVLLLAQLASGQQARAPKKDIPSLTQEVTPAIVLVVASNSLGNDTRQGSGFVIRRDGRVVTNFHVVESAESVVVKFVNGAFYVVEGVVAVDKENDIAVLQVAGKGLPTIALGDSDSVNVGQDVVAIGSPLSLEATVSNGIVSGIREREGKRRLFQITAPISPGSSGGALLNMKGEVIGITTSQITAGQNLNFAIPVNDVKPLLSAVKVIPLRGTEDIDAPILSGEYSGTVFNLEIGQSAAFEIMFTSTASGGIVGCMEVHRPLYGSGRLRGSVHGTQIGFEVDSPAMVINFDGHRRGDVLEGTYLVTPKVPSPYIVPSQRGKFVLHQQKKTVIRSVSSGSCPDDSVVY